MLKTHEFTYIADRKMRPLGSLGRNGGHVNGYRVQLICRDLPVDFLIEPDRRIEHEEKIEVVWTRP